MGKHIKTQIDYDMIYGLAKEVARLDPNNSVLRKFMSMENFEGSELRKHVKIIESPVYEKGYPSYDAVNR